MTVEGVEEAVREAPEEEEDGDKADGVDGLAQRELGGGCALLVIGLEPSGLDEAFEAHDCRADGGDRDVAMGRSWSR